MMIPRHTLLLLVATGALVIALIVLAPPSTPAPGLSVRGDDAAGAMLLARWIEASGYPVRQVLSNPIDPAAVEVLFVLNPLLPYREDEAARLRDWVQDGGVLLVAGQPFVANTLLAAFEVETTFLLQENTLLSPAAPTLLNPPFSSLNATAQFSVNISPREDAVVHFYVDDLPVIVSIPEGRGALWVFGTLRPFTNRGLQDEGSPELLRNLLAGIPTGTVIGFDEARHGFGDEANSFTGWLLLTAPGWGLLLAVGLTVVYISLRGRRFGQPVPLPDNRLRREPVEYIQAMAHLTRRAGHRAETLKHYRAQFRRRLCERYGLDPRSSDDDLLKAITSYDAAVDAAELRDLLTKLAVQNPTEAQLVESAAKADAWMRKVL